ncbi:Siderophore iron transporter mirB [Cytospora mali]|uniref:Siderophore iron transporter mirB n=1 Tax=Cytospora mali TaxID=578113 RepID=A0A194VDR9_CYTMA|nr:Siderophore iron transporter mirB [Valsa mali var. pyri (nom. inval.)]
MKFRGGVIGFKPRSEASAVEKTAQSTGTDAEIGVKTEPDTSISPTGGKSLDEKIGDNGESDSHSLEDRPAKELQYGVQLAEASVKVWTREHLILAYILRNTDTAATRIWLVNFVQAFSSGVAGTFTVYVTSDFSAHSLTATTSILASLMAGLIKLPYAKFLDNFGRPQGFCLAVLSMTIGLVMMAACQNVETYCAAQVFYQMGYSCIDFSITIFVVDTAQLKNRALMLAYTSSPWLITTWVYGPACERMLDTFGFRWGFGIWAIIFPVVCSPLAALFWYNAHKAVKAGLVHVTPHGRRVVDNLIYYGKEFDVIGVLTLATGLGLFLLSFSLYAKQPDTWSSPLIICFLVFGSLLVIAFVLWEKYLAPVTFIPWPLLKNRTIIFTFTMMGSLYSAWYIWDSYFYSMNIVVFNQSVTDATYIGNIYTVGATVWSFVMGVIIRYNGRIKWQAVCFGVPMTILGVSLMIHFRQPDVNIGYIVMCQIFIAFGGGALVICEQITVQAVSKHQDIPALLAVEGLVASVGGSIGLSIASAMWQGIFPQKLAKYLPADAQSSLTDIYGSIDVQSSYPVGSATRDAINRSYGDTQRLMLIASTCLYSITWVSTFLWEDVDVKSIKPLEGLLI